MTDQDPQPQPAGGQAALYFIVGALVAVIGFVAYGHIAGELRWNAEPTIEVTVPEEASVGQ